MNNDKPDWNIGYTTRNHLCLDLDNTSYYKTQQLVTILMDQYPPLGDAIILESSINNLVEKWNYPPCSIPEKIVKRDNYHVVFDNIIPYEKSCEIIEILATLGVISPEFIRIRSMRNDMTLRVSQTVNMNETKPRPRYVSHVINQHLQTSGNGIFLYNKLRRAVQDLV